MAAHMIWSDFDEIRMFKLHRLVENAGVNLIKEFMDKQAKSQKYKNGLQGLLNDPAEQKSIVAAYKQANVEDKNQAFTKNSTVDDFLKNMNISRLKYLMQCSPKLKAAIQIPLEHDDWWYSRNAAFIFKKVYNSESELVDRPGSAILVLYHMHYTIIRSSKSNEFSLNENEFPKFCETTKKAIRALGVAVHGPTKGEVEANKLISEALRIEDGTTRTEFRKIVHQFYGDIINQKDVIRKVLNDRYVQEQYMNNIDVDSMALHLTGTGVLDYGNELQPLQKIATEKNRKLELLDLLRKKLDTYEQFDEFCSHLKKIQQAFLADVFQLRFSEEIGKQVTKTRTE